MLRARPRAPIGASRGAPHGADPTSLAGPPAAGCRPAGGPSTWSLRVATALAVVTLTLAGCTTTSPSQVTAANDKAKADAAAKTDAEAAAVRARSAHQPYRPASLPNIALTPPLLFEVLAAEIAIQRQQLSSAYSTYQTLATQTRDARIARRATEVALSGRAFEQALNSSRLWQELDPASNEAQQTVETLQLATGRLKDVEPALVKRLAKAREDNQLDEVYLQLQRTLPRIQDRAAGWAMLQRLSATDLNFVSARVARSIVASAADDKVAAAAESAAAVELAPRDPAVVLLAAQQAEAVPEGEAKAQALLRDFLARSPDDVAVRLGLGRLYLANRKLKEAEDTLKAALSREPQNPQVIYSLAQTAYQANQPAQAEQYLKRFVDLPDSVERDNAPAWLFLGQIAEEGQRLPDAIGWLEKIQSGELFLNAVTRRAVLTARQGRVDEARALVKATTPRNARERQTLVSADAQVLREAKQYAAAFETLDKALTEDPTATDLLYDHAMAADKVDRIDQMEKSLRRLIELRPDSAHAYNALGYTFADRNIRLPEALELITKADLLQPNDAHIVDSLGWVQYRMGNLELALKHLRAAYALKPDVEVAAHLGEVLWASGRRDEALKIWRDASGREPTNEVLRGTLARLNVSL
jgi:tetratricopeptide (TPR) repeat protein